jgi:hypothetical protein
MLPTTKQDLEWLIEAGFSVTIMRMSRYANPSRPRFAGSPPNSPVMLQLHLIGHDGRDTPDDPWSGDLDTILAEARAWVEVRGYGTRSG